jgi:hypothetical protein
VPWLSCSDEILIVNIDGLKKRKPRFGYQLVGPALRIRLVSKGRSQNLFTVLIGSSQQKSVLTALTMPPGYNITGHLGVGMADVRGIVDVEDRRSYVKRLGH